MYTLLKIWLLVNMAILCILSASAQEQATPKERALIERITGELNNNIACSTTVQTLLDRIKELEAKAKSDAKPN